jgi:hypothetical protein
MPWWPMGGEADSPGAVRQQPRNHADRTSGRMQSRLKRPRADDRVGIEHPAARQAHTLNRLDLSSRVNMLQLPALNLL